MRRPRVIEPEIPEGITGHELDRAVKQQLRTLSKENAEGVAQHLVMVSESLADNDLDAALAHAQTVVRRAARVPAAREALGIVLYRRGEYAKALNEFRTARRLSGSSHVLPMMVDAERALGRTDKALELASSKEAASLTEREAVELAIVVSGIRRDLGQRDAALVALQIPALRRGAKGAPRLSYAYAEALLALGREDEAREYFSRAAAEDPDGETDAAERLDELDGIEFIDLGADDDEPDGDEPDGDELNHDDPDHDEPDDAGDTTDTADGADEALVAPADDSSAEAAGVPTGRDVASPGAGVGAEDHSHADEAGVPDAGATP